MRGKTGQVGKNGTGREKWNKWGKTPIPRLPSSCFPPPGEEASEYWDSEKPVLVAPEGSTVTLPCVNRNHIWTERHSEEEQQVVHWDRQPPGVPHDRADRLVDLYASGERRSYGPLFLRQKMNVTRGAFALGDFSLRISHLESADEGTYSCHLHHHYCGLHERRIYHVAVTEPARERKVVNLTTHSVAPAAGEWPLLVGDVWRIPLG